MLDINQVVVGARFFHTRWGWTVIKEIVGKNDQARVGVQRLRKNNDTVLLYWPMWEFRTTFLTENPRIGQFHNQPGNTLRAIYDIQEDEATQKKSAR